MSPDGSRGCCGFDAVDDARRVAHKLGMPYYVLDFRREFQQMVIDDFCSEYARGRTPNPCIRCNRFLKFDLLSSKARALGARFVATGHYARVEQDDSGWRLKRPADSRKDQTYFLYSLSQVQLAHTLFPLGDLTKSQVREIARGLGLVTADKKESQEICFAPKGTYSGFLLARHPELNRPGDILDRAGRVIGRHKGIVHYTIGQRRRIGIAAREPLYVVAIDAARNTITVGRKADVYRRQLRVKELNFIGREPLDSVKALVQIRYQHKPVPGTIRWLSDDSAEVTLDAPEWAITPGQAAVFYDDDTVFGGGVIE